MVPHAGLIYSWTSIALSSIIKVVLLGCIIETAAVAKKHYKNHARIFKNK